MPGTVGRRFPPQRRNEIVSGRCRRAGGTGRGQSVHGAKTLHGVRAEEELRPEREYERSFLELPANPGGSSDLRFPIVVDLPHLSQEFPDIKPGVIATRME